MTKILQADQDWLPNHIVEVAHLFDDKLSAASDAAQSAINIANAAAAAAAAAAQVANNKSFVLSSDITTNSLIGIISPNLFTFEAGSTYLVRLYLLCQASLATTGVRFCPVDTTGNAKQFSFRSEGVGGTLTAIPPVNFTQLDNSPLGTTPVASLASAAAPNAIISTTLGVVSTFANTTATLAIRLFPEVDGSEVRILAGSVFEIQKIT